MADNLTFQIVAGTSRALDLQAQQPDGTPFPGFLAGDALAASLWPGGDGAALATPTATWLDAVAARFRVSFLDADTAALDPAIYRLQARASRAGRTAVILDASVQVLPGPGTSAPPAVYCTYQDLLDRAPWLAGLQSASDRAGFVAQRALARRWFDHVLQRHYRGGSGVLADFAFVPGAPYAGGWAGLAAPSFRAGIRSGTLQGWLDADRLDVTSQVIEAVACHAIALVCEVQVAPGKEPSPYARMGAHFARRADITCAQITAEIDSDGDGTNDTWIRLGIADTLEG